MPPAKCNRTVILFDLNTKNQLQLRAALLKIYSVYYFEKNNNLVNLVLVNSELTDNRKNERCGKGYEHILEVNKEEIPYDPTYIYGKIEVKNVSTANWKEAVRVAIQILKEDSCKKVITYQILFLTDLSHDVSSSESLDNIKKDLENSNIFLYIVGPEVQLCKTITHLEEIENVMNNNLFHKENHNIQEVKQLLGKESRVTIADIKTGLQLFFSHVYPIGKQPWSVPLTFGTKLEFQVATSKLMETYNVLYLKPLFESLHKSYIFVNSEDSTKTYNDDEVRHGISKHGKFIPLPNNDLFKTNTERTFSLMFITHLKDIPEYMMKGPGCYTVIGSKTSPLAFESLISRLEKKKCCLIVKRVYSKGNSPIYLALVPNTIKKCFRAVQLPYSHEVPFEWMEMEPQKTESGVSEDVSSYLENITINSSKFSLNCPLTPNIVNTTGNSKVLNASINKLLSEQIDFEQVDYDILRTGISMQIGERLRSIWPSRSQEDVKEEIENCNDSDNYEDDDF